LQKKAIIPPHPKGLKMKRCLSCNGYFDAPALNCPHCGTTPAAIAGFTAYSPESAQNGNGFKTSYFSALAQLEAGNFWFCARNRLILWALKTYCPNIRSFLEIGCGTGFVLTAIARAFPQAQLHGSDLFSDGLSFAAQRVPTANLMQMDAQHIPFYAEFAAIGAFDVLEHIADDRRVLAQIHAALKPQGYLILTVPQHPWLWSHLDDYACHVRRYEANDLHQKITAAGFTLIRSTSFVSTLLPAMMLSRWLQRRNPNATRDASAELKIPRWLNTILAAILRVELAAIKIGLNLPIGGSRFILAQKRE
jgi:SAM-dependent methyltransferase